MKKRIASYVFLVLLIGGGIFVELAQRSASATMNSWYGLAQERLTMGSLILRKSSFPVLSRTTQTRKRIWCLLPAGEDFVNPGKTKGSQSGFPENYWRRQEVWVYGLHPFLDGTNWNEAGNPELARKSFSPSSWGSKIWWIDDCYYLLGLLEMDSNELNSAESFFKKLLYRPKGGRSLSPSFLARMLSYKQRHYEHAADYFRLVWEKPDSVPEDI